MFWRNRTNEDDLDELKLFVDGMKRGQTPATGDSLLETLRQIHDRREAPVVGHDHKRMLAERLRRQMALRNGESVDDTIRVPEFAIAAPRRRFLEWAVAASLVFHAGLGVLAIDYLKFGRIFNTGAGDEATVAQTEPLEIVHFVMPPVVNNRTSNDTQVTPGGPKSAGQVGNGTLTSPDPISSPTTSPIHTSSNAPVGPPVMPGGGAPIVAGYSSAGLEGQADHGIADGAGPSLGGPSQGERPWSEVGRVAIDKNDVIKSDAIDDDPDVLPRPLNKPRPIYTAKALEYQITGKVRVSVMVGADGTPSGFEVKKSLGYGLDEAAIDAVRMMRFSPATLKGVPVKARVTVEVEFAVR